MKEGSYVETLVPIRETTESRQLRIPLEAFERYQGRRFEELKVGSEYEIIDFDLVPPSAISFSVPVRDHWVATRLAQVLNCGIMIFRHGMDTSGLQEQYLHGLSELPEKLRMDVLELIPSLYRSMLEAYSRPQLSHL